MTKGQIELYLMNDAMKEIFTKLTDVKSKFSMQLTLVELFDSVNIYKSNEYMSQCLMSLMT